MGDLMPVIRYRNLGGAVVSVFETDAYTRLSDARPWAAGHARECAALPRLADGAVDPERPRWGWLRVVPELVEPRPPLSPDLPGRLWHGSWEQSSLDDAMHHAAVEIPARLRQAALVPRPWPAP